MTATWTPAGRLALRQARSRPILEDLKAYLERERPQVLPKSPIGQAIAYTLSNWEALVRYTEDGDLEIDNNGAERSLRGVAVGRRNWTFFGSDDGGHTAAVLTSLIATASGITSIRSHICATCSHASALTRKTDSRSCCPTTGSRNWRPARPEPKPSLQPYTRLGLHVFAGRIRSSGLRKGG